MSDRRQKLWLAGVLADGADPARALSRPFDGAPLGRVEQASSGQMAQAIEASVAAFESYRRVSRFTRSRLLSRIAEGIRARKAEIAERITDEAGKPIMLAEGEVERAITTFTVASEETKRYGGEVIPVDLDAAGRSYSSAFSSRFPRGPVFAIAPFNFPLNLVAHKVAPALAVGASVIVKPSPQAPGAAGLLAEIFAQAALEVSDPKDPLDRVAPAVVQVLSCSNDVAGLAIADARIAILSFTGSDQVGWMLQSKAVRKKVALELGGNAGVIVCADADLERAAARCAFGGFAYSGQVCISVQRIFADAAIYDRFQDLLLGETAKIRFGEPRVRENVVGPMIDRGAADRVMAWIDEARAGGGRLLIGGKREGNTISPTILTGVPPEAKVCREEVFGPVVVLEKTRSVDEALHDLNQSRFGLQAGIFTDSASVIRKAFERLEVGSVLVNEVPTYRADHLPYGGVRDSGLGREGLRYAMEEFSEQKTLVQWTGRSS
jgi:glyceraldehyde-3-phosphate dehydrogenase (NADP+)